MRQQPAAERRWAPLLLGLGVVLRLALQFPVHRYPAEADAVLAGMCAQRILGGDLPVFLVGFRHGSIPCFVAAPAVALLGPSRLALAIGPLLVGLALMVVWYLLVRDLFGWRVALAALPFIAIPPPAVGFWLYMPNSYPETLTLCALILWMAVRVARRGPEPWRVAAYGLVIGLGLWNSMLTLGCTAPSLLWLALRERRLLRPRWLALLAATALLGIAPLLLFNLRYGFPTLTDNFAARPAADGGAVLDNLSYLVTTNLPELVADLEPTHLELSPAQQLAGAATLLLVLAATWTLFSRRRTEEGELHGGRLLAFGVIVFVALFYVASTPGSVRGLQVRYVLPIALWVPPAIGFLLLGIGRRSRPAAAVAGLYLLAFNLAALELPGSATRRSMAAAGASYSTLVDLLDRQGVEIVMGSYWDVYGVNYFSSGTVKGIPVQPLDDYFAVEASLPPTGRWAVMGSDPAPLSEWIRAAGGDTRVTLRSGRFAAVVAEGDATPAVGVVGRLRQEWARARADGRPYTAP